jgi:hypothetical protein
MSMIMSAYCDKLLGLQALIKFKIFNTCSQITYILYKYSPYNKLLNKLCTNMLTNLI